MVERERTPEDSSLLEIDPAELMRDNPAALIVNKESYHRMGAHFSPLQLDPPQVAWVRTFNSEQGEIAKLFVIDGMTRTKFASDNKGNNLPDYPNFSFDTIKVRDVTNSELLNPLIVPDRERAEGQQSLSMIQYLRAVVPPTAEHSQIASDRIAAHLINGWENMVGKEVSDRFSALSALNLLNQRDVSINEGILQNKLDKYQELIAGENPEERMLLESRILEMAAVIREAKLRTEEVTRSAFILVSAGSQTIGGERSALRQIFGMLYTPEIERKIAAISPQVSEQENLRMQLRDTIATAFKTATKGHDRYQTMNIFGDALRDEDLTLTQGIGVLTAESPIETYRQIKENVNVTKLLESYKDSLGVQTVTEVELSLIDTLGRRVILDDKTIAGMIRGVSRASNTVTTVSDIRERLVSSRDNFLENGITARVIDDAITAIDRAMTDVYSTGSMQHLSRRVKSLQEIALSAQRSVTRENQHATVNSLVTEVFAEELEHGFGALAQRVISSFIVRQKDMTSEEERRELLVELSNFDSDVQVLVITGQMRLDTARNLQAKRNSGIVPGVELSESSEDESRAAVRSEVVFVDASDSVVDRKSINNENVSNIVSMVQDSLQLIDLEPSELTPETKREIDSLLNELGKLRYNHPDIVRVLENYHLQLQQNINNAKARINQEQEESLRETRTHI